MTRGTVLLTVSAYASLSPAVTPALTAEPRSGHWRVLGVAATVGTLTSLSKLAGAAKVIVTARFFGTGDALDAFLVAFLLPSFLSDVVAGSFTPCLIPVLVRTHSAGGADAAHRLIRRVLAFALTAMLAAAAVLGLTGRWLLPLAGSSFSTDKLHLATKLFFGLLFWLPMSACIATWRAVLNANGIFALAAIAPLATPLACIVLLYTFASRHGVTVLCVGTVSGVAMECVLLALAVRRLGYPILPRWDRWPNPALETLGRQYFPLAASAMVLSGCAIMDQAVAARLGAGQVSTLEYGNKLAGVLLAVAASAVGTSVLPVFSRLAAVQDWQRLRRSVFLYSSGVTLLIVPLTVGLIVYSGPLVQAFFQHGAFQAAAAQRVTQVQRMTLLQAPFAILLAIATRLASALSVNRFLIWMGVAALIMDILLDIALSRWMGVAGIALATPCVQCVSLCILLFFLRRHEPRVFSGGA
jgi:putative peptidoglycan lipid II flippase